MCSGGDAGTSHYIVSHPNPLPNTTTIGSHFSPALDCIAFERCLNSHLLMLQHLPVVWPYDTTGKPGYTIPRHRRIALPSIAVSVPLCIPLADGKGAFAPSFTKC